MPRHLNAHAANGPAYDLIFGVHVFDPDLKAILMISPYVINGTLYLEAEKLSTDKLALSTSVKLYRYNSKTGFAEQLPLLSSEEMQAIESKQQFVFSATKHLTLDTNKISPDGYSLAEPNWVHVNPIVNVLGKMAMFLYSGRSENDTKRETTPRLAKGVVSTPMRCKYPILKNEADDAFLLGWIVNDSSIKSGQ